VVYDTHLAERIRECLDGGVGIEERQMFGGLAFLLEGNMSVGVIGDALMVRVGKEHHDALVDLPGARIMDFTGRPMRGWLVVGGDAIRDDDDLAVWVERGTAFASTLSPK
jgi:TfoX/Sxy family transcriptional regulator of competence genes